MPSPDLTAQEVRSIAELRALAGAWTALWRRCPGATVFQRPEWIVPWCTHLLRGEPFALAVWRGPRLVGLFPFFRFRAGDVRALAMMGVGVSDYQDALIDAGDTGSVLDAACRWLWRRHDEWERCEWSELVPDSALLSWALGPGVASARAPQEVCPALEIRAGGGPVELVPRSFRADVAYARRRATREPTLRFEAAGEGTFESLFASFVRLHRARRAALGEPTPLTSEAVVGFHFDAARALLGAGALALYGMRLHGRCVAAWYGFHDRGATRYYLSGFDPEYARWSVGTLIIAHALHEAHARGATLFDFLRGSEPYKYRWGARDRVQLHRRVVTRGAEQPQGGACLNMVPEYGVW